MTDSKTKVTEKARDSMAVAVKKTRAGARDAAATTKRGIEDNPLAMLVGGIAVGVVAGALLPRTEREAEVLGPIGKRITSTAAAAAAAARDAGKEQLSAMTPDKDTARSKATSFVDTIIGAAKEAGKAAAKSGANG